MVSAGADAVDYKLISICHKWDVVVSQDYGVAAMALGKQHLQCRHNRKWAIKIIHSLLRREVTVCCFPYFK